MTRDLFSLSGRHALVTGGARGLGRMCAEALLEHGASVTITARDAEAGAEAAAELSRLGRCDAIAADLSREDGATTVGRELAKRVDALDVLVNNAGASWGAPLESHPAHAWTKVLQLNTIAPFQVVQAVLPLLEVAGQARRPARIVNVGSVDGLAVGRFDNFSYSSAKAALHHQTRVLAVELGPRGITANCIAPAPIATKMTAALLDAEGERLAATAPLGSLPGADDIAGAVIYLAAPASTHVTGTVIPIDGGMSIATWAADAP
ncbi:MAG: SDR family oxidoreductase [Patulibacter sp.]|nr:SDR family oxidoreductase [Patulibacter sp.]